jgi:hypothetical protein
MPLLRIETGGGLVPAEFFLTAGPTYTLTRDGFLLSEGAVLAIFPGPLVTPYWQAKVTPAELDQIREMIGKIGLDEMVDEHDEGPSGVADAPTTVVTYWDDRGEPHRYSAYALGFGNPGREESRQVQDLISVLEQLAGREAEPYEAEKYQFVAIPGAIDPTMSTDMEWPLEEGVDTWKEINGFRCAVLDAADLEQFADANQATTFASPDADWAEEFRLAVRPLHPGETGCEVDG